jgi:cytochrome P450
MTSQPIQVKYPLPQAALPYHAPPGLADLVEQGPVLRAELPDGSAAWLVTRFSEIRQVLADQRFSRALAASPDRVQGPEVIAADSILGMDPPRHSRLRKLVAAAFTARRVELLRPQVAGMVAELIDGLLAGPCPADLVRGFSLPLPVRVICGMLGVPASDQDKFHGWVDAMLGDWSQGQEEMMAAYTAMREYISGLIALKRQQPGDDLMSALIAARDGSDRLSEEELVRLCVDLMLGGYETTANQINVSLLTLLEHPAELARLRADAGLVPRAVEELLRFVMISIGILMPRITTEDVPLGGVTIPTGEAVVALYSGANRDPAVFTAPDRLDLSREVGLHLTFGAGIHHCLGAQLARMELQEALRGLLWRLPGLRLAVPVEQLRFSAPMAINSVAELPVSWDKTGRENGR